MPEIVQIPPDKPATSTPPLAEKTTFDRILSIVFYELIPIVMWLYGIIKLFVFDVDVHLAKTFFPQYEWVLSFKFFIFFGCLAIVFLVLGNMLGILWIVYVALYPLIVIFWKIPFRIFKLKSWTLGFVFVNFIISFFRSFRYGLLASAVWSISFALLYFSTSPELIYLASGVILFSLSFAYARRFILAFKPNALFQLYTKIFSFVRTKGASNFELDSELKALSPADLNTKQLETWKSHLESSVLFNRTCLFAAKRLRDYQNSGSNIVSAIFTRGSSRARTA